MAFANPALNEQVFDKEMGDDTQAGWASPGGPAAAPPCGPDAPAGAPPRGRPGFGGQPPAGYGGCADVADPPFETTGDKVMTTGGTFTATLVLFVLLLVGGWFGWQQRATITDHHRPR